jgi:hypothetical protein
MAKPILKMQTATWNFSIEKLKRFQSASHNIEAVKGLTIKIV